MRLIYYKNVIDSNFQKLPLLFCALVKTVSYKAVSASSSVTLSHFGPLGATYVSGLVLKFFQFLVVAASSSSLSPRHSFLLLVSPSYTLHFKIDESATDGRANGRMDPRTDGQGLLYICEDASIKAQKANDNCMMS